MMAKSDQEMHDLQERIGITAFCQRLSRHCVGLQALLACRYADHPVLRQLRTLGAIAPRTNCPQELFAFKPLLYAQLHSQRAAAVHALSSEGSQACA